MWKYFEIMGENYNLIEWNCIAYVQIPEKFQLFSLHIWLNLGKDSSNKIPKYL